MTKSPLLLFLALKTLFMLSSLVKKSTTFAALMLIRVAHMLTALGQKFKQNDTLGTFLKSIGMSTLVEANPKDQYWGAGISLDHDDIWDCNKWNGRKRLGELLKEIRQSIK